MWEFFTWLLGQAFASLDNRLTEIINNQGKILLGQDQIKEILMGFKEDLQAFATKVDDLTNAEAASVTAIIAEIEALKAQIPNLTPVEAQAILDGVTTKLQGTADTLAAVAAGGTTVVPPPTEEPPL